MNIAVTGSSGFIGKAVADHFKAKGHKVLGVDRSGGADCCGRKDFLEALERRDLLELDAIIHMGACTDTLCQDRQYLAEMNTDYSKRLWTACAQKEIKFIYASSAATYGDGSCGFSDDYQTALKAKPLNPYGDSKKNFDLWAFDKATQSFAPPSWAGLKFFNVYGPGEAHKGRMASMVYQAAVQARDTGKIRLFKDGTQKRDFIFVDDVVRIIAFLLDKTPCCFLNVGTGWARTYNEMADAVFKAMGKETNIEYFDMPEELKPAFQNETKADIIKLKYYFDYDGEFTQLEDGAAKVVASLGIHLSSLINKPH